MTPKITRMLQQKKGRRIAPLGPFFLCRLAAAKPLLGVGRVRLEADPPADPVRVSGQQRWPEPQPDQKSMPPMPPMPPPGIAGADLSSGTSETVASVVMRRPATEAAFWSAVRTTLVGSITPAATRFS